MRGVAPEGRFSVQMDGGAGALAVASGADVDVVPPTRGDSLVVLSGPRAGQQAELVGWDDDEDVPEGDKPVAVLRFAAAGDVGMVPLRLLAKVVKA